MKKLSLVVLFMLGCGADEPSTQQPAAEEANAVHEPMHEPMQSCDRACLIAAAQSLFEHPERGQGARLTENGRQITLRDSWLSSAPKVQFHNAYADEAHGQVMVIGSASAQDADKPAVFGLRAKLKDGKPEELELMLTRDGEASLFPPKMPLETDARYDEVVPEASRASADTMIGLANRYFDGIQAAGDKGLPVADDCNRVENGVQTTRNPQFGNLLCNSLEVFVYIPVVEQRRFPIVDEEHGVAVAIVVFQIPGGDYEYELNGQKVMRSYTPRSLYLFEGFKVSDGKIQHIEATMRNLDYGVKIDWPSH
jgi:hypothetical protein